MQLQGRRFAHRLPDGVTVRHFDAIANGKLIVLRAEGQPVATVVAPTFQTRNKWALTEPVTIDGETYVLAVGYVWPCPGLTDIQYRPNRPERDVHHGGHGTAETTETVVPRRVQG
jgi:hypothetical protein